MARFALRLRRAFLSSLVSGPVFFSLFFILGCTTSNQNPQRTADLPVSPLCQQLSSELGYIHATLAANNSNYNGDKDVRAASDTVFNKELDRASGCQTDLDYARGVRKYLASFNDPHLGANWQPPKPVVSHMIEISTGQKLPSSFLLNLRWSSVGVFLQRYGQRTFVKEIDPKLLDAASDVQVGDELKNCASFTPDDILEKKILPFVPVSAHESAVYTYTPSIFVRWDQLVGSHLNCEFLRYSTTASEPRPIQATLTWKEVPENYLEAKFQPAPKNVYRLEKIAGGHWLTLNSFAGYDDETNRELKQFVDDAKSLRKDQLIVIDIRGNHGGNSSWGTTWIENLYGYGPHYGSNLKEFVFASPGNIAHYENLHRQLKASGGISDAHAESEWQALFKALKQQPSSRFYETGETSSTPSKDAAAKFSGRVIVLTDFNVFSSGETFLEQLRMMPKVKQAGVPTNASTYYSDIRFALTPAGLPFHFPTKMESGDPLGRKSGQALKPDLALQYDPAQEIGGQDSLRRALEAWLKTGRY